MPSHMERAIARAHRVVQSVAWVDVTYVRPSDPAARITLRAVKTEADVESLDADGAVTVSRVTAWRILAEDLVAGGERIRPRRGDRIEWLTAGKRRVYEAMPVGDECYQPADPYEHAWKITTRLVSEQ